MVTEKKPNLNLNDVDKLKGGKKGEEFANLISKRLYTLKEVSIYLGRGLHGVRDMVWSGQLPIVRNGRKMFVDIRDLERYIDEHKQTYI